MAEKGDEARAAQERMVTEAWQDTPRMQALLAEMFDDAKTADSLNVRLMGGEALARMRFFGKKDGLAPIARIALAMRGALFTSVTEEPNGDLNCLAIYDDKSCFLVHSIRGRSEMRTIPPGKASMIVPSAIQQLDSTAVMFTEAEIADLLSIKEKSDESLSED